MKDRDIPLSEKQIDVIVGVPKLYTKDVAEAVKKLKGRIDLNYGIHKMCAIQAKKEIDKIMGDFSTMPNAKNGVVNGVVKDNQLLKPTNESQISSHSPNKEINKGLIEEVEKTIVEPIMQDINRIIQQSWDYFQKHDVMSDFNCYVINRLPDNKWNNKILRFLKDNHSQESRLETPNKKQNPDTSKDICANCEHYVEFNGDMVCDNDTLEFGDVPFLVEKDYSCKKFKPLKKEIVKDVFVLQKEELKKAKEGDEK